MVELASFLSRLKPLKVVVAGDLMLDAYVLGNVQRISPEAPVPVMRVQQEYEIPGGAGNVMLNLASLGVEVHAIGRVGTDSYGSTLLESLKEENINTQGVFVQHDYNTPVKKRVIANNQQMLRLDYEEIVCLPKHLEKKIIEMLPSLFIQAQALAISDYGKGFLSEELLKALIQYARYLEMPVIVDPKGIDFKKYSHATLLKPNLSEAYAAAKKDVSFPLSEVASSILEDTQVNEVVITRSEKGISLFSRDFGEVHFPVEIKEVKDVTGAGDTVLAVMTHALASGLTTCEACYLSNVAAGIAIEKLGCSRVSLNDLANRLLKFNPKNKIFDNEQIDILKTLLLDKKLILLNVTSEFGISTSMIQTIFDLADSNHNLIIHIQEKNPSSDFINVLSSLQQVDYIVINQNNDLHSLLSPNKFYCFEPQNLSYK